MDLHGPDAEIRQAAFDHVTGLTEQHGVLSHRLIAEGFRFQGMRIPFVNPQRGIFKPRQMSRLLSIRTVHPVKGRKIWYDDQRRVHQQIYDGDDLVEYAFMGEDPDAADNVWLRDAWRDGIPVIYFLGIAPAVYMAILPVFIAGWAPERLKAYVSFAESGQTDTATPPGFAERRYSLHQVKRRLHQTTFRESVLAAYRRRCAISGLPEARLLDAAHIIPDRDEFLGQPEVSNGLPLSKLHHAAFDAHLIGIDPDYRVHVSPRLLEQDDGPLLEQSLKAIDGQAIRLPRRERDRPDRDRLAARFEQFIRHN